MCANRCRKWTPESVVAVRVSTDLVYPVTSDKIHLLFQELPDHVNSLTMNMKVINILHDLNLQAAVGHVGRNAEQISGVNFLGYPDFLSV